MWQIFPEPEIGNGTREVATGFFKFREADDRTLQIPESANKKVLDRI